MQSLKALILAAGDGTRIKSVVPKVLLPLCGVPLIQRTILTLKDAGITDIIIIVGFKEDVVKNYLGDGSKYGVNISYATNGEYERENGTSILKAEKMVDEKFLLVMGDHIFTSKVIKGILKVKGDLVIATDSNPKYIDVGEATKILTDADEIKDIGKDLTEFNAVDTGIFLCSKQIFPVITECVKDGKEEWSDSIKKYIENHKAVPYDASASIWLDVDTKEDLKKAEILLARAKRRCRLAS